MGTSVAHVYDVTGGKQTVELQPRSPRAAIGCSAFVPIANADQICAVCGIMRRAFGSSLLAVFVSLLLAIGSVAMGSMHGAVSASDAQIEAFIASGGNASDICGDVGDGQKIGAKCVFCLIAGNAALPAVAWSIVHLRHSVAAGFTVHAENLIVRRVLGPARSPRGPPVLV
jgi:hypothetical protein